MNIQEKIKEGIRQLIDGCYGARNPDYPKLIAFQPMKFLNELLPYLHSQGAVVKVDRVLPRCPVSIEDGLSPSIVEFRQYNIKQWKTTQEIMLKAGYVAVEPLIKEGKNADKT